MKKNQRYLRVLVGVGLLYFIYIVGKTMYQSYQVRQEVENLKVSITEMQQSNKELSEKIIYYQSASYREKIARERMGLQKPGEEVIVILPEERPKVVEKDPEEELSNYKKWWNFFFKS
jgi:cell division protein FtsL